MEGHFAGRLQRQRANQERPHGPRATGQEMWGQDQGRSYFAQVLRTVLSKVRSPNLTDLDRGVGTHTHLSGVFESYKPRGLIGVLEGSQEITGAVLRNVTLGISQDSDRHVALDATQ